MVQIRRLFYFSLSGHWRTDDLLCFTIVLFPSLLCWFPKVLWIVTLSRASPLPPHFYCDDPPSLLCSSHNNCPVPISSCECPRVLQLWSPCRSFPLSPFPRISTVNIPPTQVCSSRNKCSFPVSTVFSTHPNCRTNLHISWSLKVSSVVIFWGVNSVASWQFFWCETGQPFSRRLSGQYKNDICVVAQRMLTSSVRGWRPWMRLRCYAWWDDMYIHIYYVWVYTYVYMYVYLYIHIHMCIYIYIHLWLEARDEAAVLRMVRLCVHTYILYTSIYMYMYVYLYTHIHTYTYIYLSICGWKSWMRLRYYAWCDYVYIHKYYI